MPKRRLPAAGRSATDKQASAMPRTCVQTRHTLSHIYLSRILEKCREIGDKIRSQNAARVTEVDTDDIITHCAEWYTLSKRNAFVSWYIQWDRQIESLSRDY